MIHLHPYKPQRVEYDVAVGDNVIFYCMLHLLAGFQILDTEIGHLLYQVGHQEEKQFHSRKKRKKLNKHEHTNGKLAP